MAEANHAVTVHVVTRGIDKYRAEVALAHRLEPERDRRLGLIHRDIPDVRAQEVQFPVDDFFGRTDREHFPVTHADDAVEYLRAVHALGSLAVTAAPQALDVERDNRSVRAFNRLRIVERESRDERLLGNFAFGEDDYGLTPQERIVNALHGRSRIAAIDVDEELSVREPALVPVRKSVPVTCNAKRPGRRHLEHGPVNKAEMRTHQKNRASLGNVLHAHDLHAVTEHESEREAERGAQERHRGVPQVRDEAERKDHRENHEAVIERHRRKDEQQSLPAHDEHEERHLDGIRHRMDAARGIGARKAEHPRYSPP